MKSEVSVLKSSRPNPPVQVIPTPHPSTAAEYVDTTPLPSSTAPDPQSQGLTDSANLSNASPTADRLQQSTASSRFPGLDEIYKVLSVYIQLSIIRPVAAFLMQYFICKNTTIRGFQVSTFKGLIERPDTEWPMLQWEEPDIGSEVFIIFKVNTETGLASSLLHSGTGPPQPDGRRWSRSSISWWVLGMDDFKDLIIAALQVLDVLKWSDTDMIDPFFDPTQTDSSPEQMIRYAEMLFPSLSRLANIETSFDHTSFWIERLSRHSVISGEDGRDHSVYQASVPL